MLIPSLQLARAGFYYKPSTSSEDSVTCFLCDKALDGWEEGDIPATEHLSHVPNCGWAINVCIEQRSQAMDRAEEDPNNEKMMESRRSTFRDVWPHEARKGWKCKVQKVRLLAQLKGSFAKSDIRWSRLVGVTHRCQKRMIAFTAFIVVSHWMDGNRKMIPGKDRHI